jgi:hypothetical protein
LPKRPGPKAPAEFTTAADFAAAADAAAEGIDPEAPGCKERAMMMGFIEAMDPDTRRLFEQYMENQLQQVEQEQQQASAEQFLQAALDKAAEKTLNRSGETKDLNPGQVFDSEEEGQSVMWQALRGKSAATKLASGTYCVA